jgi:uncharacterized protein (TIGR02246 family)
MEMPGETNTIMFETDNFNIQKLYQKKIEGWNNGDGEKFAEPYTEDADYIGFDGTYLKGRQEIASFHQMLFDKFLSGSRLIGKIKSIRFLTSDVAVVVAIGGTIEAGQSNINPERNSIHTIIAIKHVNSKWFFTAFQNTRAQYLGRPDKVEELTRELEQEKNKQNNYIVDY